MKQRILSILVLLGAACAVSADVEPATAELQVRSEWWPDRVTVNEPVEETLNGQTIKPGRLGFVVRLVGDDVLIDFGRYGVIQLPIAQTDFVDRSQELRGVRDWQHLGNWTAQFHTKLMAAKPTGFQTLPIKVYDDKDYFLIFYLDHSSDEGQQILSWMRDSKGINELPSNVCLMLIPDEHNTQDYLLELIAYEYPGLTLVYPLAKPYRTILNHQPEGAMMTVIDKNGRAIVDPIKLENGDDLEAKFSELQRGISQDVDIRKTLSNAQ